MIETPTNVVGERRIADGLRPVKKQVVVIEYILPLLGLNIGGEERPQLGSPSQAPWKGGAQNLINRKFRVHAARIDGEARSLGRKSAFRLRESDFVPTQVHQVGQVFAIVDGERRVKTDLIGIIAEETCADAVEGAGPA